MKPRYSWFSNISDSGAKKLGWFLFLVVIVVVAVGSVTTAVGTGKVGVVTQFGQVTGRELNEGLQFKLPWQQVTIYDVRVQKEESQAEAATTDLQNVSST